MLPDHGSLGRYLNWDRFASQVIEAIEQPVPVVAKKAPWPHKAQITLATLRSLYDFRIWYAGASYALLRHHFPPRERRYRAKHRI